MDFMKLYPELLSTSFLICLKTGEKKSGNKLKNCVFFLFLLICAHEQHESI